MFEMKYGKEGQPLKNEVMESVKNQEVPNAPIVPTVQQVQEGTVEAQEDQEVHEQAAQTQEDTQVQEPTQHTQPAQSDDGKSRDWRELREKSSRAERERDEAMRRLSEYERMLAQQASQPKPQEAPEDDDIKLGDDELAEGKHLSKVGRKIKKLEEQLKQYQQQTTIQTTEARLKATYPDFEAVVTRENLEKFSAQYPELSSTINTSSNDIYAKAVSAYTMIKKFGITTEPVYEAEKIQAQKNAAKPRPLSSVSPQQGESALTRANAFANGLTNEVKEQLRREMEEARRNM